jgi:hypothetical protein
MSKQKVHIDCARKSVKLTIEDGVCSRTARHTHRRD